MSTLTVQLIVRYTGHKQINTDKKIPLKTFTRGHLRGFGVYKHNTNCEIDYQSKAISEFFYDFFTFRMISHYVLYAQQNVTILFIFIFLVI